MSAKEKLSNLGTIDRRSLLFGLATVSVFYLLFYFYITSFSEATIKDIEKTLASQIILINHELHEPNLEKEIVKETPHKTDIPLLIEGLYQKNEFGNIPVIRSSDKLTSFDGYKRKYSFPKNTKPVLAIIITDFGISKSSSEIALELLPAEVSFSLSPYADMAAEWAKILRQSGHEFWAYVPLEQSDSISSDSGEITIFENADYVKNQKTLQRIMAQIQSYPGISSTSSLLKETNNQITKAIEEVFGRGLGYLELNPSANSSLQNSAISHNAPYIKADIELIFRPDRDPFQDLEIILKSKGYAVAVVQNYPQNIKRLAEWLVKVAQADYELSPVSSIYELPLHQKINAPLPTSVEEIVSSAPEKSQGDLLNSDKENPPEHSEEH